jgi:tetratricopeptide (TPR) repeat protein
MHKNILSEHKPASIRLIFCKNCVNLTSILMLFAALLYSCQSSKNTELNEEKNFTIKIDSLEKAIFSTLNNESDSLYIEQILTLSKAYQDYVFKYADDSLSPEYLFRCAQLMEGSLNDTERAAELYTLFLKRYPAHKKAGASSFFLANALHTLGKNSEALELLSRFEIDYPSHPLQAQANELMEFIKKGGKFEIPETKLP